MLLRNEQQTLSLDERKGFSMARLKILSSILLSALAVILFSYPARSQATRLNVGYSAISGDQLPAWIAKETGIFQKNGLDVQLIFFTGGSTAVLALVSGDVPISQVAGNGIVHSALGGSDAVMVAGGVTSLNYWLMGRPNIKTAEQLKGGSVAISRFGSATDFIARFALQRVGLIPGKDVTIVQIGSAPARLDATMAGRVNAAVINPPASFIALKKGMTVLADVAKLGLVIQHTGAATTKKFIKEHPDVVRRYVKSQVEAVHRIYTDKETSLAVLNKYFGGNVDREILEKTWEGLLNETLLPKNQYPTLEGIRTVLEPLAEKDPKARAAKPEQFADLTFIRELDQSGYIDSLYKKK
jgi:NitT/TauT family transport system substrate-binding protein